jgi:hypothetical protein
MTDCVQVVRVGTAFLITFCFLPFGQFRYDRDRAVPYNTGSDTEFEKAIEYCLLEMTTDHPPIMN